MTSRSNTMASRLEHYDVPVEHYGVRSDTTAPVEHYGTSRSNTMANLAVEHHRTCFVQTAV